MNDADGKIFGVPIEQKQPGNVEAETQVFAKITIPQQDAATIPGVFPVMPAPAAATPPAPVPPAPAPAAPAPAAPAPAAATAATSAAAERKAKSLTRRLARRILGPTLMTKR
ncbi:hypothetical protein [Lentzea flaviverrucosa]|uniref:Translation initiation factor IF-2 n=1 Tax=Lentzea flaviverrucosa TaxID=200379 RepID=A0A1H9AY72_9PSEU|nr:hypothetical protein [Lentzea flaviverrucosa]RDI31932.1 hypothetical protein DFR72_103333 [Lentzea flaviverrucosa]SEP81732.1 translation initiation factor IF-2 [Lentzea flaviverrucosa]